MHDMKTRPKVKPQVSEMFCFGRKWFPFTDCAECFEL